MRLFPIKPTVIKITGDQRLKWLQSYVTNDMRNLTKDLWLETFATDLKGKSLSHGCVFMHDETLYFFSVYPGQASTLLPFWAKYMFIVDVVGEDVSIDLQWFFVAAEELANLVLELGLIPETGVNGSSDNDIQKSGTQWFHAGGSRAVVLRSFALGDSYALVGLPKGCSLPSMFSPACETETQALAAENFFPWFGIDFNSENLPQEADRDASAISFKKGCYLGQETIARLDALGQVQKKLIPIAIKSESTPAAPQSIVANESGPDGLPVVAGSLTSAYQPNASKKIVGWTMMKRKYFKSSAGLKLASGESFEYRR